MTRLVAGGRIDRTRPLRFSFDGRAMTGFAGDTLASALLANGVRLVGRSTKFHRKRGILTAGAAEPNALVRIDRGGGRCEPNTPATMQPLFDGLAARSQNRFPSLRFDAGALAGLAAPLLPAGFYYKTFLSPRAWHRVWEPLLRGLAGLGRAPALPDPDPYANRYAHCDVLVVGAGPAGLAAALAAAESGARVILCDEQEEPGGSLLSAPGAVIEGRAAWDWLAASVAALRAAPRVRVLAATTAFHYGAQNFLGLAERLPEGSNVRERLWQVRARRVVLATGAIERPLLFAGNDRPEVMLASAARTWLHRFAVLPGRRAVLASCHDSGWRAAFDLQDAGATIAGIVDRRAALPDALTSEAARRGIAVFAGHGIAARRGGVRVLRGDTAVRTLPCDLVLMAGGWTPSVHLFSQSRGLLAWDAAADAFLPAGPAQNVVCIGACRGSDDAEAGVAEGYAAGAGLKLPAPVRRGDGLALREAVAGAPAAAFLDWQNDVKVGDIRLAVQEGFRSIEHVKRYTTTGMATDQGKLSNMPGLAVAAAALGCAIPEVGFTSFRAPYTPVTFGTLAGRHRGALFEPQRSTPLHARAAALGAAFEPVGLWQRARFFPRAGEAMHAAVARECRAVRNAVGIFDASTLGKIEVVGPDAAEFLDRMYVNALATLPVGRCRYALLLREDGFLFDDGIVARLAADRFHVTTTTAGAARVLHMLEDYLQTEWPDLRAWLTSTTEHWAVVAVQGPRSPAVLGGLVDGIELEALAHMAVAECRVAGVAARLFRVGFTGERGYEINIPAGHAGTVWDALLQSGAALGITPYGTEAMHVLRAEKGYLVIGQDTDGRVTPDDAGLARAIGRNKRDFVGKRSLERAELRRPDRRQLVGLLPRDGRVPPEGAQSDRDGRFENRARPHHLVLCQRDAGPADRAGAAGLGAGANRPARGRARRRRAGIPPRCRGAGLSRSRRRAAAWLTRPCRPCRPARGWCCGRHRWIPRRCRPHSAWRCRLPC